MPVNRLDDLLQNRAVSFSGGVKAAHQRKQRFCIGDFLQIHGSIVVKSAACGEDDSAMVIHHYIQQTVFCCDGIEIVDDQQAVLPQFAQQSMVSAESGIRRFGVIHIIGKAQTGNVTFQVSGVGEVDDVGVLLAVAFGIGFYQFAFTNTSNALKKHFSLRAEQFMQSGQFRVPSAEIMTWSRSLDTINKVFQNRRKRTGSQQVFGIGITLPEFPFHSEKQHRRHKVRLVLVGPARIASSQLVPDLVGNCGILQKQCVQLLCGHGAVVHQWKHVVFHIGSQHFFIFFFHVEGDNSGADSCLPVVKGKIPFALIVTESGKDLLQQADLINFNFYI